MRLDDWRTATLDELAPCYAAERTRWHTTLRWETARTWQAVEAARHAGTLPGFVLRDEAGTIRAWSFHLLHRGELQLGGLVTPSAGATERLMDAVLHSAEAQSATQWMAFGWFDAPGLDRVVGRQGAGCESYLYLFRELSQRPATIQSPDPSEPRAWRPEDDDSLAPLLASAYNGADAARPFAANGTMPEWFEYVGHLLHGSACGTFDRELSCVSMRDRHIEGAAVMTRLMPATAHLAQLAVRHDAQRRGLGEKLLMAALDAAGLAGCDCMSLLVRETNEAARRLYARLGFSGRARFLSVSSANRSRRSALGDQLTSAFSDRRSASGS